MTRRSIAAPFALALLLAALPAQSATLFVSPDGDGTSGESWESAFRTINEAVIVGSAGTHVWIKSAKYVENVSVEKSITLLGGFNGGESLVSERNYASNITVIDGNLKGNSIVVRKSQGAVIDGIFVTNASGIGKNGGGILIEEASATIRNCTIFGNETTGLRTDSFGGGIKVWDGAVSIQNCTVFGNNGAMGGGGVFVVRSNTDIDYCRIYSNEAWSGAGIVGGNSFVIIKNSSIFNNSATNRGGGCHFSDSQVVIESSTFFSNSAIEPWYPPPYTIPIGGQGAALFFIFTNTADIHNCLFVDNLSDGDQCAYIGSGENEVVFRNCTILARRTSPTYNRSAMSWVRSQSATPPTLINCIVDGVISIPHPPGSATANVTYSSMKNGYPGEGNIDADPMFVDPEDGDFRLMRGSPCIDSGTDTGLLTDLDGNPRPIGLYDMGAYEFPFLRSDINGDGVVDALDLLIFSEDWKKVSGP